MQFPWLCRDHQKMKGNPKPYVNLLLTTMSMARLQRDFKFMDSAYKYPPITLIKGNLGGSTIPVVSFYLNNPH